MTKGIIVLDINISIKMFITLIDLVSLAGKKQQKTNLSFLINVSEITTQLLHSALYLFECPNSECGIYALMYFVLLPSKMPTMEWKICTTISTHK